MNIKKTRYRGNLYGSRTEARWAVFMSVLGVSFDYQPDTFVLDDGSEFTPSFFLPKQASYITVVSSRPDLYCPELLKNWASFSENTKLRSFLFTGPLPDWGSVNQYGYGEDKGPIFETGADGIHVTYDSCYQWTRCTGCGQFDIQYEARSGRCFCHCEYQKTVGDRGHNGNDPAIIYAYRYAKAYNFTAEAPTMRGAK